MQRLLVGASLGILGVVAAGCENRELPTAPTPTVVSPAAVNPAPAPAPVGRPVLRPSASLSGTVSEMTASGRIPVADVQLYCDACGEFGHTWITTDSNGAYDFGGGGIWDDGSGFISLLIDKSGYRVPGGIPTAGWSSRTIKIDGATRFDFELVRQ